MSVLLSLLFLFSRFVLYKEFLKPASLYCLKYFRTVRVHADNCKLQSFWLVISEIQDERCDKT